jgi:hypothetical protein
MVSPPPFAGYPKVSTPVELEREQRLGGPGWMPAWTRVWRDSVDVTDDPELYPFPWLPSKRPGER